MDKPKAICPFNFSKVIFITKLHRGKHSTKGDNPELKKNTGQLFFDEESIYEISKPYLKICLYGRTSPKQYAWVKV